MDFRTPTLSLGLTTSLLLQIHPHSLHQMKANTEGFPARSKPKDLKHFKGVLHDVKVTRRWFSTYWQVKGYNIVAKYLSSPLVFYFETINNFFLLQ